MLQMWNVHMTSQGTQNWKFSSKAHGGETHRKVFGFRESWSWKQLVANRVLERDAAYTCHILAWYYAIWAWLCTSPLFLPYHASQNRPFSASINHGRKPINYMRLQRKMPLLHSLQFCYPSWLLIFAVPELNSLLCHSHETKHVAFWWPLGIQVASLHRCKKSHVVLLPKGPSQGTQGWGSNRAYYTNPFLTLPPWRS